MVRKIIFMVSMGFIFNTAHSQFVDYNIDYGSLKYVQSNIDFDDGLIKKSENEIFELLQQFPENPSRDKSLILKAKIDYSQGNLNVAFHQLSNFIKTRSNSPFIPFAELMRGLIAYEQEKYNDAEVFFEAAVIYAESDIEERDRATYSQIAHLANFWYAVNMTKQGRTIDAIPPFVAAAINYPNGEYADEALYNVGRIYELNMKHDSAISYFRLNYRTYPYRNTYLNSLVSEASNLLELRQATGALLALNQAETLLDHLILKDSVSTLYQEQTSANNIREIILYLKGEAYNIAGNYEEAAKVFEFFLQTYIDSEYIDLIRLGYGWSLLNLNKNKEALVQYNKIIEKNEDNLSKILTTAQLYKVIALKRDGQKDTAKKELLALSSQPAYPLLGNVLLELGQVYYEEEDYDVAIKTLERASLESQDGRILVRINLLLASAYMEKGLWDRATKEYKKAIKLAESSNEVIMPRKKWYISEANLKLGISLINSMRSAEAIPHLQYFIAHSKDDARMDEAIFWIAEAFYKNDLMKNAIDNYEKIINYFPASVRREESLYGAGWSYFRMKQFEQSSKYFNDLVSEFPKSKFAVEVLTRQGDGYYLQKSFKNAAEFYQRASKLSPGSDEGQYATYQLANAQYRMGANEQAISSLLKFVQLYNKAKVAPNALYLVGWIRFQENKYKEAIDNFHFMINAYSQSTLVPRAYYAIGDCYYNMGDYENAITNYKTVIESYPGSDLAPEAIKSIQFCLIALGRESEAIDIANKYVETNPESPFAPVFQKKIGEMFYQGQKYNDAISEFSKFVEKHPQDESTPEVLYMMAKSYVNLNNYEKAKDIYKKVQLYYPKSEWAATSLLESGLLSLEMANVNEADSLLASIEVQYPNTDFAAQGAFERALIKYKQGDTVSALNLFLNVHNKYKDYDWGDQSIYRIAMHYRANGQYDSARTYFNIISDIKDNPKISSEARYRIGELYFRDKDYENAIKNFIIVKDNYEGFEDWYSLALINLGESYEKTNNIDSAKEIYNTLEIIRPNDDFGKTAKSRLKRLKKN
ncbi:MAG TPA: tetratricopeptide repeat protein [Candidatus Kapabacteria bacterium]|nr:tetratricopeptide repeat protein [Candidatus Kapabacteria bacterium]